MRCASQRCALRRVAEEIFSARRDGLDVRAVLRDGRSPRSVRRTAAQHPFSKDARALRRKVGTRSGRTRSRRVQHQRGEENRDRAGRPVPRCQLRPAARRPDHPGAGHEAHGKQHHDRRRVLHGQDALTAQPQEERSAYPDDHADGNEATVSIDMNMNSYS